MLRALIVSCLILGAAPLAFAGEKPGKKPGGERVKKLVDPEPTPKMKARIAKLIKDLGSEKPEVRDAARKALVSVGRQALPALRAAAKSKDAEVADAATKLISKIEGAKARSTVKITSKGSREKGNFEITVFSSVDTVTVRDFKEAFALEIKPADGKIALYAEPDKEKFKKKYPKMWAKYAEPILDTENPDRAVKEAMVRELMPQFRRKYLEIRKREPKPEELAAMEKLVREKLDKLLKKKRTVIETPIVKKPAPEPVKSPRRRSSGPVLVPLD